MNEIDAFTTPDNLEVLEGHLLTQEQVACKLNHHFGPGIYIRELEIPAGCIAIGHAHKGESMNILLKGTMHIIDGSGIPRTIEGPMVFVAPPGRKAVFAVTDCVFQNIHATTETDLAKIEEQFIEKSATWLDFHRANPAIEGE